MRELRLGIVQLATEIEQVDKNFDILAEKVRDVAKEGVDVVVLPETWNTGFITGSELHALADESGQRAQTLLGELAQSEHVNIFGGSVAVKEGDSIYNRTYVYNRKGELLSMYDKMHGFSPAKEDQYFTGGTAIHQFEFDGVLCSSATCYDIRFPELIRKSALQGIELFFLPAQWPMLRLHHWRILNQARAIENQMYFCSVNGCGTIGKLPMAGHSMVVAPWGEVLLECDETPQIQSITIDVDTVKDIRSKINVFRDRKPNCY